MCRTVLCSRGTLNSNPGISAVALGHFEIKERALNRLAWETVLEGERAPLAVEESQDGAIWLLTEGDEGEDLLGIRLYHILGEQTDWVDLPRDPALHKNLQPYDGNRWYVKSMVIDSDNRLWFLFNRAAKKPSM